MLEQAEQLANRALELAIQRANEMLQMQATFRLAHIHAARGNISLARDLVKALETKIQNPVLLREIHNRQVLLSIQAGDVSSLDWWVKIITTENENVLPLERERETFNLARLRISQAKPREALEVLRPWLVDAADNGRVRSHVEAPPRGSNPDPGLAAGRPQALPRVKPAAGGSSSDSSSFTSSSSGS